MISRFEYTHSAFDTKSTAIDHIYYNKHSKVLAVDTVNDNVYFYENVPFNEYQNFESIVLNTHRSAGQFWNWSIKPVYQRLAGTRDRAARGVHFVKIDDNAQDFATHKPTAGASFEVVVELNGTLTIKGEAADGAAALTKVHEILAETFKGDYKVRELKQKFD